MLANEKNRLAWKDSVLNSISNDESTKTGSVHWLQRYEGLYTGTSRASNRTSASTFDDEVSRSWTSEEIVGPSTELRWITVALRTMAQTDSAVLIVGETGTCKEIIARSVYALSHYFHFPFVHVNCELARPEEILVALSSPVAENRRRPQARLGGFHLATRKTVFLEGITKLSPEVQYAVLQALRSADGESQGASSLVPKRIRLIASSNIDLLEATRAGGFSNDLYQYLDMLSIKIPALRDRTEDIPMLINSFLERHYQTQGQPLRSLNMKAVELLQLYPWPGNLRELWHVMDKFLILREAEALCDGHQCRASDESPLYRQLRAVPETADIDECERIITSLIQALSLRSQET